MNNCLGTGYIHYMMTRHAPQMRGGCNLKLDLLLVTRRVLLTYCLLLLLKVTMVLMAPTAGDVRNVFPHLHLRYVNQCAHAMIVQGP